MVANAHFIDDSWMLQSRIIRWLTSSCNEIKIMASKMETKFEKYWDVIHGIMVVATVLDPRFKMKLIEYYFHRIYRETAGKEIESVPKYCYELVREYQSKSRLVEEIPLYSVLSTGLSGMETSLCEEVDHLLNFDLFVCDSSSTEHMKLEFDQYLEDGLLPRTNDFNKLAWWKTNRIKYPIMFEMARDILAIHVYTVASESEFSASGRFLSPYLSKL
ncbi:hypothetical protein Dsin_002621 [Dipteronia sinensis]|uniref:Uncharacterized protein n=1 Tax=Dipteronia sinensis TaxID=43782 RepID=A0AAE0ELE5_9ROSI|nr:hypothetical protein Dsin_002621 [Dipteronia sinensis]